MVIDETNTLLRFLDLVRWWWRYAPLIDPTRWPLPVFRTACDIAIVHLQYLSGIFDDEIRRTDKIGKRIIARTMTANTPFDTMTGIAHATTAAHHRIQIGHDEGNVIKGISLGIGQCNAVVITAAMHKGYHAGAIGQFGGKCIFVEPLRQSDVFAIEYGMRDANRIILAAISIGMRCITPDELQNTSLRIACQHGRATSRLSHRRRTRQHRTTMLCHILRNTRQRLGTRDLKSHLAHIGYITAMQSQNVMRSTGTTQIHCIIAAGGNAQIPGLGIELLRRRQIGYTDGDAA